MSDATESQADRRSPAPESENTPQWRESGELSASIALSLGLQVAVVELPCLHDAFHTTALSVAEWAICVGLASVVL